MTFSHGFRRRLSKAIVLFNPQPLLDTTEHYCNFSLCSGSHVELLTGRKFLYLSYKLSKSIALKTPYLTI